MSFDAVQMVHAALPRIRPHIRHTIVDPSPTYSQRTGADVAFKCENLQHTGSFKVRGALNKILSLDETELARGIVTASTGNHGAACAYAVQQVNSRGIVFVPETAVETKLAAIRSRGAEIRTFGRDSIETEIHARSFAAAQNMTYIPPYNDPYVVAGQGTIAVELLQQLPQLDVVLTSVGGGGLIGGIASYLKASKAQVQVIGCSPENSQVMAQSVAAGKLLDLPSLPTLSDGSAGGVESDSMTFPLCRDYVDQFVSVTEAEIADALRGFMDVQHMLIEGSAAVPLAAFLKLAGSFSNQCVAILLCGANISLETLRQVLSGRGTAQ
jgi:threonine dehydratase